MLELDLDLSLTDKLTDRSMLKRITIEGIILMEHQGVISEIQDKCQQVQVEMKLQKIITMKMKRRRKVQISKPHPQDIIRFMDIKFRDKPYLSNEMLRLAKADQRKW